MKLSQVLWKQHIGRQIRNNWYSQGKVTPFETNAEKILTQRGIPVIDAEIYLDNRPKNRFIVNKNDFLVPKPLPRDSSHPDYKEVPCLQYGDNTLLLEGIVQAQHLTKTVLFNDALPDSVEKSTEDVSDHTNELVQRLIKTSVMFDAHQELLPKIKDPLRPAWNFPRQMGITDLRKALNLNKKMLQLCDHLSGPEMVKNRSVVENGLLCYPFEREFELFEFTLTMDLMLLSKETLKPNMEVNEEVCKKIIVPDMHPLHPSIGFDENHFYDHKYLYPVISGNHQKHLHTIFVYHDPTKVKNKTELTVRENQTKARSLVKAFTAAACSACEQFGKDVKELPKPVTVQSVYSNGKDYYFSVYQLNTLNLDGLEGLKNYYWMSSKMSLYETGAFVDGVPTLEGYNPEVFKKILTFYKNK
ncbi:unnamed protein product [Trichogramma brassicae]|uniref:Large ribosomal subunit protein mL37 n=1 Tax=Trichogramma brassicae TaxID=86971 RepID=A0A6H5I0R2_9HYME|nr:unnamed protein product [Trichogramma brassicae]